MMLDSPYRIYMSKESRTDNPYGALQHLQPMGYNQGVNQYPQQMMAPPNQPMYQNQQMIGQQCT